MPTNAVAKTGTAIDGFARKKTRTAHQVAPTATRKQDRAKTLMRPAVKKPVIRNDVTSKRPIAEDATTKARELRAKQSSKSPLVHRFNHPSSTNTSVPKRQAHLPVALPATTPHRESSNLTQRAHHRTSQPNIFEQAIKNADSHLKEFDAAAHKKSRRLRRYGLKSKAGNIALLSVAVLLLAGFFTYQNAPAIEMRLAAAQAGVPASMPGYKPAGYGATSVKHEPGKVSVSFRSRTDNKGFTLTQQASNWNSASLLANTVAQNKQPYQTYQDGGKTVYIYNSSNATWVDGGVWYQLEGDASLTSDQLLRIANSL